MWSWRNNIAKIVISGILLFPCLMHAQEVHVKDPALAEELCLLFPDAMSADCERLDTVKAASLYTSPLDINLDHSGITNADELIYFKNADTIRLSFNQMTSFPVDISRFRSLVRLNLANNELKVATDIKWNNPFSGDTAVKLVYLNNNQIDSIPPSWYALNGLVQVIDLYDNLLDTIPDFGTYNELRRLDLRENYLGFEELIPIKANARWATSQFDLFPQKEFFVYDDIVVEPGETLELDFNTGHPGDSYTLLKNNNNHLTSNDGIFVLSNITANDTATYWVKIRNEAEFPAQSDFLKTTKFKIAFKDPDAYVEEGETEGKGIYTFSPDGDGLGDYLELEGEGEAVFYNKSGQKILMKNLPYDWDGRDETGKRVTPGLYIIQLGDGEYLKVVVAY